MATTRRSKAKSKSSLRCKRIIQKRNRNKISTKYARDKALNRDDESDEHICDCIRVLCSMKNNMNTIKIDKDRDRNWIRSKEPVRCTDYGND